MIRFEVIRLREPKARRWAALFLAIGLLSGCATATPPVPRLDAAIDATIHQDPFDRAFWSLLVEDEVGTVLYSRNADKLTIPASNRKLFSAATTATCLGLEGRLATTIWLEAGDLVIVGDGDPTLGSARYERSDDFAHVAVTLRDRGVVSIGDVIADVSRFDHVAIPGGWKNGNIGSGYAAPVDAIAWSENQLPNGRAVTEPGLHAAAALRDALTAIGISVTGGIRLNREPRAWSEQIAVLPSPFVVQMLATVLKNSQNLYTEMLLKRSSISSSPGPATPATYDDAFIRESRFLVAEVGLDPGSFRFVDGSGLAPDNLVTPAATVRMLRWMNHPLRRGLWWSLLAQPANEGTLRRRLVTLEHRLRGKTGTVAGVNALSGIIAMPNGAFRYFSIAVNHHIGSGTEALAIIDGIIERIAQ